MKTLLLRGLRAIGVFRLCLFFSRHRLRILCYHGISSGDEHLYSPFLFMRLAVFESRMNLLARRGIPVVGLDEAIRRLKAGAIHRADTVITFDDGWRSNLTLAMAALRRHGYPACVYVTTDHLEDDNPVFNVVLWYLLWKTRATEFNLNGVSASLDGRYPLGSHREESGTRLMMGAAKLERHAQRRLLETLATELGVNDASIMDSDRFRLMSASDLLQMYREGIDVQLHTHTHQLPADSVESMAPEIVRNRQIVEQIIGAPRRHFCYPSGNYTNSHPIWLAGMGIETATTCDSGHCSPDDNFLLLPRYLDRDNASDLVFDAEVCGVLEVGRMLRRSLRAKPELRVQVVR